MLRELEQGLVEHLRASALAERLRRIETLPEVDGDRLLNQFGAEAPAVYVTLGSGTVLPRGLAEPTLAIACVARNLHGAHAARHGDLRVIGLLELLEAVMVLLDGALIDEREYTVTRWDLLASEALDRQGLFAAVVQVRTSAELPASWPPEGA